PRRRRLRAAQGPRGGRPPPPLPPAPLAQRLQVVRARHGRAAGRDGERGGPLPRGVQEGGAGAGGRHGRADRGALLPLDAHRGHGAARLGRARAPRAARLPGAGRRRRPALPPRRVGRAARSGRRRGGKVLMVNPLRELGLVRFRVPSDWRSMLFGSTVSDLYLQPHVGADVVLFKALLKGVVEAGALDRAFVAEHTSGWEAVAADLAASSWEELIERSGVARAEIDRAVALLGAARRGVFCWAMGLTHHAHGVDNVLALANLALARGWLGRPGCGLLPIRGHSNGQGVGSC